MQRQFKSLAELAAHFERVAEAMPAAKKRMLKGVGERVRDTAQAHLGEYPTGAFGHWAELAESTKERRADLGYTPNDPLLMSGALRDSIDYQIHGNEVTVGSPLDYAAYLEWGTSKMPPRPFLGPSMLVNRHRNVDAMATEIATTFRKTR